MRGEESARRGIAEAKVKEMAETGCGWNGLVGVCSARDDSARQPLIGRIARTRCQCQCATRNSQIINLRDSPCLPLSRCTRIIVLNLRLRARLNLRFECVACASNSSQSF